MQQKARDRGLQFRFDGHRRRAPSQGLLPFAAVQCGANLADEPGSPGEGKVDLEWNRQPGALPNGLGRGRIALGHSFVHDHGVKFPPPQRSQRRLASLRHFNLHAQLCSHHRGAITGAFDSSHHQNAHPQLLVACLLLRTCCCVPDIACLDRQIRGLVA